MLSMAYKDNEYFKKVGDRILTIPKIDDLCESIRVKLTDAIMQRDYWEKEYKRSKEDTYKEEEIQELTKTIKEQEKLLHNGFGITDEELSSIKEWQITHKKGSNCTGIQLEYRFAPTPIGCVGEVVCGKCGKKFIFRELS